MSLTDLAMNTNKIKMSEAIKSDADNFWLLEGPVSIVLQSIFQGIGKFCWNSVIKGFALDNSFRNLNLIVKKAVVAVV